jgi:hypothetical protein
MKNVIKMLAIIIVLEGAIFVTGCDNNKKVENSNSNSNVTESSNSTVAESSNTNEETESNDNKESNDSKESNSNKTESKSNKTESNSNKTNNSKSNEVKKDGKLVSTRDFKYGDVKVVYSKYSVSDKASQYGVLEGYKNNKLVWSFKSNTYPVADADPIDVFDTNDMIILNSGGTLMAFSPKDGKKVWTNKDFGYGGEYLVMGNKLVCSGWYQPSILVINMKDGKTLHVTKTFENFGATTEITKKDNSTVILSTADDKEIEFDITNYKVK